MGGAAARRALWRGARPARARGWVGRPGPAARREGCALCGSCAVCWGEERARLGRGDGGGGRGRPRAVRVARCVCRVSVVGLELAMRKGACAWFWACPPPALVVRLIPRFSGLKSVDPRRSSEKALCLCARRFCCRGH